MDDREPRFHIENNLSKERQTKGKEERMNDRQGVYKDRTKHQKEQTKPGTPDE